MGVALVWPLFRRERQKKEDCRERERERERDVCRLVPLIQLMHLSYLIQASLCPHLRPEGSQGGYDVMLLLINLKNTQMVKSADCALSQSTPLTPSFIITSSPTKEPMKQEMSANNVIILDSSNDFSSSPGHGNDNVAARVSQCASEFSLHKACEKPEEKMSLNNPFFKLRSRSTVSLVDEEIKMVNQREEELKKERENLYGKDRQRQTNHMNTLAFGNSGMSVYYGWQSNISTEVLCSARH
uniref:Uncharacterized protein n=1 Tax=Mola mola TaxID=94237 RepID=A0A3Q3WFH7_MOLML